MVTVKCSDPSVYDSMKYYLTGEGRIFDYLHQKGNVNYWCLEKYNKMVFCI
ncbi:MAG: hypothetical protein IKS98_10265 [Lachnospiraceae bacterium]|nr:hypothetical protein [Lachnospiraceae bacterium]